MKRIRQIAALPPAERWMLLRALVQVATVRIALAAMPFGLAYRLVRARESSRRRYTVPVRRLAWAVQAAGRRVPGASCLVQALALHRLMTQAGHAGTLHVGVARNDGRGVDAHAWVEHRDSIVLGDCGDVGRYATILALAGDETRRR